MNKSYRGELIKTIPEYLLINLVIILLLPVGLIPFLLLYGEMDFFFRTVSDWLVLHTMSAWLPSVIILAIVKWDIPFLGDIDE